LQAIKLFTTWNFDVTEYVRATALAAIQVRNVVYEICRWGACIISLSLNVVFAVIKNVTVAIVNVQLLRNNYCIVRQPMCKLPMTMKCSHVEIDYEA
jgi:hypothetical protein